MFARFYLCAAVFVAAVSVTPFIPRSYRAGYWLAWIIEISLILTLLIRWVPWLKERWQRVWKLIQVPFDRVAMLVLLLSIAFSKLYWDTYTEKAVPHVRGERDGHPLTRPVYDSQRNNLTNDSRDNRLNQFFTIFYFPAHVIDREFVRWELWHRW